MEHDINNKFQCLSDSIPEPLNTVNFDPIWNSPFSEGTSFEWLVFLSLIIAAKKQGWEVNFPTIESHHENQFFFSRNEIPRHHTAKAGHSSYNNLNIRDAFLSAFLPKAIIHKNGRYISIFREGFPYHFIFSSFRYKDRPDIIIVEGKPSNNYPLINTNNTLGFKYEVQDKDCSGEIRIRALGDKDAIPFTKKPHNDFVNFPIIGLIECSVNKTLEHAKAQMNKYKKLFSKQSFPTYLITCNHLNNVDIPYSHINFNLSAPELKNDLETASHAMLETFNIK